MRIIKRHEIVDTVSGRIVSTKVQSLTELTRISPDKRAGLAFLTLLRRDYRHAQRPITNKSSFLHQEVGRKLLNFAGLLPSREPAILISENLVSTWPKYAELRMGHFGVPAQTSELSTYRVYRVGKGRIRGIMCRNVAVIQVANYAPVSLPTSNALPPGSISRGRVKESDVRAFVNITPR